ncbi:hypothetical protein [Sorangium sp. So ce381]|uniref:hypothetical protein n=1 Tax=Sorangium sp. So ce381 TaxID=3133307 RepID=UPI003F5BA176
MDDWLAGDGPEDDRAEDIEERGEGKVKRFEGERALPRGHPADRHARSVGAEGPEQDEAAAAKKKKWKKKKEP